MTESTRQPRIVVERYPLTRTYHVNARLSNTSYHELSGRPMNFFHDEQLGEVAAGFVSSMHGIDGVTSVSLDTYKVNVSIAPAFNWEDIQPRVIELIKQLLDWTEQEVDIREEGRSNYFGL